MPQGMAGHQQYLELKAQHADAVAIVECHLSGRDALKCRAPNLRVSVGVKLCNAAHMIEVVMGDQDVAEHPARVLLQPGQHRRGITRIDHGTALVGGVL